MHRAWLETVKQKQKRNRRFRALAAPKPFGLVAARTHAH
jgi:hypothetical protein